MTDALTKIIGNPEFLRLQRWFMRNELKQEEFDEVKKYALTNWNNFQEVLAEIINVYKNLYGSKVGFQGYEHMGHGISQAGGGFSLGDYLFVEQIITPALREYRSQADTNHDWEAFWSRVCNPSYDSENPIFLKRAAVPLFIEDLISENQTTFAIQALKGYLRVDRGIPSLEDIIFEQFARNFEKIGSHYLISLIEAEKDFIKNQDEKYTYLPNIFIVEILFKLCISSSADVRGWAQHLARQWLEDFKDKLLSMEGRLPVSYRLNILLNSPNGIDLLKDFIRAYMSFGDELVGREWYEHGNPTSNLIDVIAEFYIRDHFTADALISELIQDEEISEYAGMVISQVAGKVLSGEGNLQIAQEIKKKFSAYMGQKEQNHASIEIADKMSKSDDLESKEHAFNLCRQLLEAGLESEDLDSRYSDMDESTQKDDGDIISIVGVEGKGLHMLRRFVKDKPAEVYELSMKYWQKANALYLKRMALISLYYSISFLVNSGKDSSPEERNNIARRLFEEWAGKDFSKLQKQPYKWVGIWYGVNHIVSYLAPVMTYGEYSIYREMGKDQKDMYWSLYFFAEKHGRRDKRFAWKEEEYAEVKKEYHQFLISGNTEELRSLLNDLRNNIRQKSVGESHFKMLKIVLEEREPNDIDILDMISLDFSEVVEADNDRFIDLIPIYYRRWLVPITNQIDPRGPFVYIPPTPEVIKWFYKKKPDLGRELVMYIEQNLNKDWIPRIFTNLDLKDLIKNKA